MLRAWSIRILACMLIAAIAPSAARAQSADELGALNQQVVQLHGQGKYAEAGALAEQVLAARERVLGAEHPNTLTSVNNLAFLYQAQGRYGEAEPLYRRALAARERVLGAEHPDTLQSVNNLAGLYQAQGRYGEAEPLLKRALAARERVLGGEHPSTLTSVNNLAGLYFAQGRNGEAEPLFKRALAASERILGDEHPDTLQSVNNLAVLYDSQGRYDEAEPLHKRALAAKERMLGDEHPGTLDSVNNLAELYRAQGRYGEAEPLDKRALAASERVLGGEHPDTLQSVNNLALLYDSQGRYGEAEPLSKRALAAKERVLGGEHPSTLTSVNNLAELYRAQGRYGEAEPLLKRALAARERLLGGEHPSTLTSVNNLAGLYMEQGRYGEAEPLYKRALAASERVLGSEHPDTLTRLNNLALLYFAQRDWTRAAASWRRSTAAITSGTRRGALNTGQAITGKRKSETEQNDWQFWGLVKAVHRLAPEGTGPDAAVSREMFQTAQWALSSEAAQSLAQMAARGAKGDGALAVLVRERQDLVTEWQMRDAWRNAALGHEAATRDAKAEAETMARLAAIDARIAEIDKRLTAEFPDYAALASPAPLPVEEAQAQLRPDEALVLFLDTPAATPTPDETFIWVVTKTEMRWVRSDLGKAALAREVQALRCGLDSAAWEGQSRCPDLTGQQTAGPSLRFDHARSHRLYKALFDGVEDLIKARHLLLVPSGALTQLPFAVLVTEPPANGDHKAAAWLARGNAITVLPAVSSLKALRATARPSAATRPLIGFGNPLLDGPDDGYAAYAKLAREKQSCPKTSWQRLAALLGLRNGITPIETRGGLANVSLIRRQAPLPETADELCSVARDIGADVGEMRLGATATEHEVKAISARGELAKYRVVHFATHGAMAGELKGAAEPGLILTPPGAASEEDDGYLSASEIAGLKLDADWVILSACNTAAGDAANAEALSGLARAFIYAQARALLVSHWAVNSDATVKLITAAMREIARGKTVGRAEALRRAMLGLIDGAGASDAHPANWAPFIVVGEGAAR
jgi:CHAT domain-containing protein/tetratricopeptide (TPR) repeat protein